MSRVTSLLISTSLKVEEGTLTRGEWTGRGREIGGSGVEELHSYQERGRDERYKQYSLLGSPLRRILHVYVPTTVPHLCFIRHFCILLSSSFCWLIWLRKLKKLLLLFLWNVCMLSSFSHAWLCATPWSVACQAPLSTGFSRQGYWGGLPCPPPGYLSNPGIEPAFHWQVGSLPLALPRKPFPMEYIPPTRLYAPWG